jgi:hypothetical protein
VPEEQELPRISAIASSARWTSCALSTYIFVRKPEMIMSEPEALSTLLQDMPKLHNWGGEWSSGGTWPALVRLMLGYAFEHGPEQAHIVETGAGLSTLAFLTRKPASLQTFAIEPDLIDRVKQEADRRAIDLAPVNFHIGPSEVLLPKFALDKDPFVTFAFIDGGHGFTTVWCDFTYINYMMKEGGVLAVDDTQLLSCQTLALYLRSSPNFTTLDKGKTWIFRKTSSVRLEPDFGASPYILSGSLA